MHTRWAELGLPGRHLRHRLADHLRRPRRRLLCRSRSRILHHLRLKGHPPKTTGLQQCRTRQNRDRLLGPLVLRCCCHPGRGSHATARPNRWLLATLRSCSHSRPWFEQADPHFAPEREYVVGMIPHRDYGMNTAYVPLCSNPPVETHTMSSTDIRMVHTIRSHLHCTQCSVELEIASDQNASCSQVWRKE